MWPPRLRPWAALGAVSIAKWPKSRVFWIPGRRAWKEEGPANRVGLVHERVRSGLDQVWHHAFREPTEAPMKVENTLAPQPDQIRDFLATEGPVMMVNLLKFRERAAYPDGRDADLSGEEAYGRYAAEMRKLVEGSGGRFVFGARVAGLLLGEVESLWDMVGIVEYPSSAALLKIASTPEFRAIEVHREAGLEGQLNLTTSEEAFREVAPDGE